MLSALDAKIKQYLVVTGNYWAFTLTDGALRMLVVLYFHQLGYSALNIALLFLFYEFFGVVTNLIGGWLGARVGLNRTMQVGLVLQVGALLMLTVPESMLSIVWVMSAQALSGIAKDLNKMSAKSSIKHLVPNDSQGRLYQWVAILTGSKNTLKGAGFFLGAILLQWYGFSLSMWIMASALAVTALLSAFVLQADMGKASTKPKFKDIFSKSEAINRLSLARMFLFGARDIWFVVALPVYLSTALGWQPSFVGAFMATWIIAYGFVQTLAPKLTQRQKTRPSTLSPAVRWGALLTLNTAIVAALFHFFEYNLASVEIILVLGLISFGFCFAVNSSLHSYLIVALAKSDGVSLDVGFYYMANAMGRLVGTMLSGYLYQVYGLWVCLMGSTLMLLIATITVHFVPQPNIAPQHKPIKH
ncbi:organoarsenical effux MFS transporter ArsJ [Thalassotalea aquiviva]|uniref:organoarsenical effux MFS transporter ArsJ n=1 Tax=Thalassotalea aquiviva TaxID=3242415 RepID=UPI003529F82F